MAVTQTTKGVNNASSDNREVRHTKRNIKEKKNDELVVKLSRRSVLNEPEHILKEHHGMVLGFEY